MGGALLDRGALPARAYSARSSLAGLARLACLGRVAGLPPHPQPPALAVTPASPRPTTPARRRRPVGGAALVAVLVLWAGLAPAARRGFDLDHGARPSLLFADPRPVAIEGYDGDAMEPFLSRDGRLLFFNDLNDPRVDTRIHFAERIDALRFRYRAVLPGANTPALEGVASMDRAGWLYFVSTRSYASTLSTLYRGRFVDGRLEGVELLDGVSRREPGMVNFDAEIGADGALLWFVDGRIVRGVPRTADLAVARREGDGFVRLPADADPLRAVNTDGLEYAPAISADGLMLSFTRAVLQRGGGFGLFVARRATTTEPFGAPERLVALQGYVEAATFAPDGGAIYFHRKDGKRFAIWRATRSAGAGTDARSAADADTHAAAGPGTGTGTGTRTGTGTGTLTGARAAAGASLVASPP